MKTVAIIGAGASGLTAIKCCLEEGLIPTCYERMDYIGGLWHYTDYVKDDQGCVMKSTVTNTSKEMMCFSDFPMPEHYPMYMKSDRVEEYLHMYADTFDLKQHIKLQTEVLSVQKANPDSDNGGWNIKVRNTRSGTQSQQTFDAVMICTGHHAQKRVPEFPGLSEYHGEVLHTHDYKNVTNFYDKRILVVGIGNSGADAAVELCQYAAQVYICTRRGRYILPRLVDGGRPIDMSRTTRFNMYVLDKFPRLARHVAEKEINKILDHSLYGLKPRHRLVPHQATLNDFLPNQIACGAIVIKPGIKSFTKHGVIFEDGTHEDDIDVIIFATGYKFDFPFVDKKLLDVVDNRVNLYKMIFPPDLEDPTFSVIGCVQAPGAIIPLSEIQARLATRVIKGEITLPSKEEMWTEIRRRQQTIKENHVQSEANYIQVHYIKYMDEIAQIHGSIPDIGHLLFHDPRLALKCIFGPCTPYQYRLHGPGSWSGARSAINQQWQRTYASLHKSEQETQRRYSDRRFYTFCFGFVILCIIVTLLMHSR